MLSVSNKVDRGMINEVDLGQGRYVETLCDQTLNRLHAGRSTQAQQPTLSTTLHAQRHYMTFSRTQRLISLINHNHTPDKIHIFMVYKLKTSSQSSGGHFRHGQFGHDNGGQNKFLGV